ncbi:AzlD family protein [Pseudoroseomonas globiformis]|uniref:AzlD family protein n=1 Tax=Teichococcus globiformis TaxID=2307229 RepID=A0ABV7FYZ6_9PROT
MRGDVLLAILGMAAITYLCRAGGYAVLRAIRPPPFVEAWLRNLPGPLFAAYVSIAFSALGWIGVPAMVAVILVQWRTRSLSGAILAGVAAIWGLQWLIGGF